MNPIRYSALVAGVFASALSAQGCFDTAIGTDLNLFDDSCSAALPLGFTFTYNGVPYTSVSVCSNGYLWLGSGTVADWTPTQTELLTGAPRICPLWMDWNPSAVGGGHVYSNTTPGAFTATWNNVYTFGTTIAGTMQIRLDAANGITVTYGTLGPSSTAQGGITIIGATPGLGVAANTVSLATRPVTVAGTNNWADVLTTPTGTPAPYGGIKMQWTPTVPGYVITDVSCTPNNLPGPARVDNLGGGCPVAVGLGAGDDTVHTVSLPFTFPHSSGPITSVIISSNGFLTLGTSTAAGSGCCSGDVVTLLSGPPRVAGFWTDLNASDASTSGNGDVYTSVEAGTGAFVTTWSQIGEFAVTPAVANNFQVALYPNGDIGIRYLNVALGGVGHVALCGYSDGNGAADPGATDLSALGAPTVNTLYETFNVVGPIDLSGLNILLIASAGSYIAVPAAAGPFAAPLLPLALAAAPGSLPQLGTTLTLNASQVSAAPQGNVVLLIIGFAELNPGVDLALIGAPGCTAFFLPGASDLQFLNFVFGAPSTSFGIAVPNNISLMGAVGIAQAVSDDVSANAFGWKISNGLRLTVGL